MRRQRLLVENLMRRRMTRLGDIYMFRKPFGPPTDEALDRWLHSVIQKFDFTPLMLGDRDQARIVAQHYVDYLRKSAREAGKDWDEVKARLIKVGPHMRRGLRTFFAYYDGKVKTKS